MVPVAMSARLRISVAAILALLLAGFGNGRAAELVLPSATEILAHVADVAGPLPAREHLTIAFTSASLSGSHRTVRRGDDFRTIYEEGPLHTEIGRLGAMDWHQNENGETVRDTPDPGFASHEDYEPSVHRLAPPADGYVVANLSLSGYGTKEYIDASTWRIVRRDVLSASGTTTTRYDDFRRVAGHERAWHWTLEDGHPENAADYKVVVDSDADVADAELAIPPDRRALVEFPAPPGPVMLPAHFDHDQIYVRIDIAGRGLDFLLDTGASEIAIDADVAKQLGLAVVGVRSYAGSAQRFSGGHAVIPEIRIGDLRMHDVVVATIPSLRMGGARTKVVGLLGFDFIDALGLKIDYAHQEISAVPRDAFAPPGGDAIALDARLGGGSPQVDVRINGALGKRFVLDTGASGSLVIFDYFARRYPKTLVDLGGGENRGRRYAGVGGAIQTEPYQVATIELGPLAFHKFVVYRVISRGSFPVAADGLIGADLLRYFDLYTDYAHGRLYLAPNDDGRAVVRRPNS